MLDRARTAGVPQATELVRLFQGGIGVATYYPTAIRGDFAGYVNGVIAIEAILGDVTRRLDPALQLAVSERRGPAAPGDGEELGPYRLRRTIAVLNREWQLELSLASEVRRPAAEFIQLALGIVLSLVLFAFLLLNRREQQRSAAARVRAERERKRLLGRWSTEVKAGGK